MKILKIIAAILLLATSLFALSKEQIKPEIEAKTTKVIEILKNNIHQFGKTKTPKEIIKRYLLCLIHFLTTNKWQRSALASATTA